MKIIIDIYYHKMKIKAIVLNQKINYYNKKFKNLARWKIKQIFLKRLDILCKLRYHISGINFNAHWKTDRKYSIS